MPTRLAAPVFTVDAGKMHQIDTSNVENLYSMWTVFNKCAESMEEGRRLENLSWRLWNRETLCCGSKPRFANSTVALTSFARQSKNTPSLSSSVESAASEDYEVSRSQARSPPFQIKPLSSGKSSIESLSASSRTRAKHTSSQALEKMVLSIKETKINQRHDMTGLSPYISEAVPNTVSVPSTASFSSLAASIERGETTPVPEKPSSPKQISEARASHSSASTAQLSSSESQAASSSTVASEISNPPCGSPGVVRGFTPSSISVHRTSSHLSPSPAMMPMRSCLRTTAEKSSSKGANFMLGGSSEDEESSSLEDRVSVSNGKSPNLQLPKMNVKTTSFDDEVKSRRVNQSQEDEDVFETSDEDDVSDTDGDENDDDDDDDDDWEDSASESGAASPVEKAPMFQRVDSKPNLPSRRSMLTTMMHQSERANAIAEMAAVKSQPNLQRSRTSTPNGPSVATSPEEESYLEMQRAGIPRSKPMVMAAQSNHAQSALSPRTTRRNMLATELTESLRKHLLWERQQKNTTANAVNKLKRRHTAHDNMVNLKKYPGQADSGTGSKNNSWNHYFDHGLGEYHQKGW